MLVFLFCGTFDRCFVLNGHACLISIEYFVICARVSWILTYGSVLLNIYGVFSIPGMVYGKFWTCFAAYWSVLWFEGVILDFRRSSVIQESAFKISNAQDRDIHFFKRVAAVIFKMSVLFPWWSINTLDVPLLRVRSLGEREVICQVIARL